ncbi:MAG: condensation domain-containing protein, partial [Actinobacteria bacterium]|nr:condensation domain-containing protein [Actinomycetota bacterium]
YLAQREDLRHVVLRQGMAHDLSFVSDDSVDLVILNSVVQYFPDMDYLLEVLAEAVRVTRPGGHIFVGDVRSLPLLEAYHTSVQVYKAADQMVLGELQQHISQAQRHEEELVVDPVLFDELGRRWEKVGRVETRLKAGAYDNELSRFRYDVTLRLGKKEAVASVPRWLLWDEAGRWQHELEEALASEPELSVGVRGMRDGRVAEAVEAVRLLHAAESTLWNTGQLRAACAEAGGEDPDAVIKLAQRLGVEISWEGFGAEGVYEVVFRPRWGEQQAVTEVLRSSYRRYGNAPSRSVGDAKQGRILQEHLRQSLPDYMVPSAVLVVPCWPLTPNGKLDRRALPVPERQSEGYRALRTLEEEMLCEIFAEVLSLERVGLDDNFFELGGHSLMATRLVSRVRATLGVELAIRTLFESPTVAELALHLQEAKEGRPPLVRHVRPERLPLSYAQERLWFIDRFEGTSVEYNMPEALRLRGELDLRALVQTIQTLVQRHESLRTHFAEVDGVPIQIIAPALHLPLPVEDLSVLDEAARPQRVAAALRWEWQEPFDLACGPLLRVKLLKLGAQEHILLRTCHHIVSDGWSQGLFNREFMLLYEAFRQGRESSLEPLAVQYADFALWQRAWLDEERLGSGLAYWKQQLADIPERLELPTDRPRPVMQTFAADLCSVTLPAQRLAALQRLSQENQATLYMTLLSAFAVLLHRYSGQDDIVVGSPIANRQEAQLEAMIGFFVNSLVMRVRVKADGSFRQLLSAVRSMTLDAYLHQDVPFERLVEELSPERSLNSTPVFQVVFALQNAAMEAQQLEGLKVEPVMGEELRVRFDLELHALEQEGELRLYWMYNRALFEGWRIEQMARHYERLLAAVVAVPDERLYRLDMLSAEERQSLLEGFNATAAPVPEATLAELFEEQVERAPEALALVFGPQRLSYGELNERANRLAHHLIGLGVGPETLVGVALERSVEMVMALLGILKAGGAYLPLDPDYPEARLAYMLADAAPVLVMSSAA